MCDEFFPWDDGVEGENWRSTAQGGASSSTEHNVDVRGDGKGGNGSEGRNLTLDEAENSYHFTGCTICLDSHRSLWQRTCTQAHRTYGTLVMRDAF